MRSPWWILCFLVSFLPLQASAYCFQDAGHRYKQDPVLLEAIGIKESGLRQQAINQNRDKKTGQVRSSDYGVMQVNTIHVNRLIQMGLINSPDDLLADACFNVQVGAWVLAQHLRVCGNTWRCLGSYNAGFDPSTTQEHKRLRYAQDVRSIYNRLKALGAKPGNLAIR